MIKRHNKLKKLIICLVCSIGFISGTTTSNADENLEKELRTIIESNSNEQINVEDGIALQVGESRDFSAYKNWTISKDGVVEIDSDGRLTAIGSGTVFLSQKIGEKVYIVEIYVIEESTEFNMFNIKDTRGRNYYKVFVDAGHGGSDPGAVALGVEEAKLNLDVAKKVEQKLKAKNIQVKMSRNTDIYLSVKERAELANEYGADVLVSIHQNSYSKESVNGIETLYHPDKQIYKPYAADIQNSVISTTGANSRGLKDSRDLGVLRVSHMPSALLECGFITNASENSKLKDPVYQDKIATGIVNGVEKYLNNNIQLDNRDLPVINSGYVVNTDTLNVRSGYGTNYPMIGRLSKGDKVEIVESKNGWHKIKYNDNYGYVSGEYISVGYKLIFKDIDGHWAKSAILEFVEKGYIKGYEDNTFRPDNSISRAEFVRLVNQKFGYSDVGIESFMDVNEGDWYYNDVCIAVKQGYIKGRSTEKFDPNEPITREEVAKIIATTLNKFDSNIDKIYKFTDGAKVSSWAVEALESMVENGYLKGYTEDNTIRPQGNTTRAEAVSILQRIN